MVRLSTLPSPPSTRIAPPSRLAAVVAFVLLALALTATQRASAATVAAGASHACAVQDDTTVRCWGKNDEGQLGNGTKTDSPTPTTVLAPGGTQALSGVIAVAAGRSHSCALLATGSVDCWGWNLAGQLGGGSPGAGLPVAAFGLTDAVAIAADGLATCAVRATGGVDCWGENVVPGVGGEMFTTANTPTAVDGITDASGITITNEIFCARHTAGSTSCWTYRKLLATGGSSTATSRIDVPSVSDARSIASSPWGHSCIARGDGRASCWGGNNYGQLGTGATGPGTPNAEAPAPVDVVDVTDAVSVSASDFSACALHATGAIDCWGRGLGGVLGNAAESDSASPVAVRGITDATELSGTCAARADRTVWCWGGQYGPATDRSVPTQVAGVTLPVAANYPVDPGPAVTGHGASSSATAVRAALDGGRPVRPGGGSTGDTGTSLGLTVSKAARAAATAKHRLGLSAGYLAASGAPLELQPRRACPTSVTVRIARGSQARILRFRTAKLQRRSCALSAVAALPAPLDAARTAKVTISGKGVKTRSFTLRRG